MGGSTPHGLCSELFPCPRLRIVIFDAEIPHLSGDGGDSYFSVDHILFDGESDIPTFGMDGLMADDLMPL